MAADQAQAFFDIGKHAAQECVEALQGRVMAYDSEHTYRMSLIYFFTKAYKSYQAIELLWREGFEEDAAVILRTIFEIDLQARYIATDPATLANLYAGYELVSRYQVLQRIKQVSPSSWGDEEEEVLAGLEEACRDKMNCYRARKPWHAKTIGALCDELGDHMRVRYATAYALQSCFVHSDIFICARYCKRVDNGVSVTCYPRPCQMLPVAMDATFHLLSLIELVNSAIGLTLDCTIQRARECYDKAAADTDVIKQLIGKQAVN